MKKSFIVLLHAGFWACYFLMVAIVLMLYYKSNQFEADRDFRVLNAFKSILLFAFTPSFISFYAYHFLLFPRYLEKKQVFQSVLYGILISLTTATAAYILLRYFIESGQVVDMDEGGKHGRSTAGRVILVMTTIGIMCGVVSLIIDGFITWYNEIKLKQNLKEKNLEMEIDLIKKQLDPHLLFNTINNIDSLILRDAVAASDYLNKLSDIMRFVLYETRADKILLSREIEYIEKYISLQKIRTSNEHYVNLEVTGKVGSKQIAPMIFIPFIENAFKHTHNKKLENAIAIRIFVNDETIEMVCENKFDPGAGKQAVGGLGNELIQKRLNLTYPGKHTLEVQQSNERYIVNLTIHHG